MKEKEYWGIISEEIFNSKIEEFTTKFGQAKNKKRLSLGITDWTRPEIDNRIKITNGKPEFVQKLGDWNTRERDELEIPLIAEVDTIYSFHKAIIHTLNAKDPSYLIIQHDNYLFDTDEVEIKLSHQFGKSDKYNFEVELKTEDGDLDKICSELGLQPDNEIKDKAFWDKWNEELNIDVRDLSKEELKKIIASYLN